MISVGEELGKGSSGRLQLASRMWFGQTVAGARRARLKQQAAGQALRLFMGCRGLGVSSPCGLV